MDQANKHFELLVIGGDQVDMWAIRAKTTREESIIG